MLWYSLYIKVMKYMGFKVNPHDRCEANNMINVKHCTKVWYINDNKISHVDENIVAQVLGELKDNFGYLVISRRKKHIFLGMKINIREDKKMDIKIKGNFFWKRRYILSNKTLDPLNVSISEAYSYSGKKL